MYIIDEKNYLIKRIFLGLFLEARLLPFLEKSPVEYLKDEHKYPTTH